MTNRRIRLAVGASLFFVLFGAASPRAQTLQRAIYASVLNKAGMPVPDLTAADFIVREEKLAREILRVEPATAPMQVALLVDNSQRSNASMRDIRDATNEFIKGMTGGPVKNEVAVIAVADRATVMADYSSDQAKLLKAAGPLFTQPGSGAYMLDAIYETARGFKKREAARPVIVAIATNGPELSNRFRDQVIGALTDVSAALHVIMVGTSPTDFTTSSGRERAYVYSEGTEKTGGRYDNVLAASALPDRLKQVAAELTHQYLVTYARPQSLIPPEHITITSKRPDLTVRGTPAKVTDARGSR